MIINNNISSIFSNRQLFVNTFNTDRNLEKLSSGMRINRGADDASGLAVSEKMRAQISGLNRAAMNAQDGISFIQTTEGYLETTENTLQRIRELAVQSANGIYTDEDRQKIQVEIDQLIDEVDRIASHAQFNGLNLLTGRFARDAVSTDDVSTAGTDGVWIHLGANMDQREKIYVGSMTAYALGLQDDAKLTLNMSTTDNANRALGIVDNSLSTLHTERANLGAFQRRLEYAVRGIMIGSENLQAAESRIRDTNMASESSAFVKNQILTQAATAMLAQANQRPQLALQLLR